MVSCGICSVHVHSNDVYVFVCDICCLKKKNWKRNWSNN
jgi:hypothetical protein